MPQEKSQLLAFTALNDYFGNLVPGCRFKRLVVGSCRVARNRLLRFPCADFLVMGYLFDAIVKQFVQFAWFVKNHVCAQLKRRMADFRRRVVGQDDYFLVVLTVAAARRDAEAAAFL